MGDRQVAKLARASSDWRDRHVVKLDKHPKAWHSGPEQSRVETQCRAEPIFARGKLYIYVCDSGAARRDARLPARLNNWTELAKFLRNVLPGILEEMKLQHGWSRVPRTGWLAGRLGDVYLNETVISHVR